jgi:predicted TPR repeat methyltransferase
MQDFEAQNTRFSAIDAGCGNGWATRMISKHELCDECIGVDAAELMVKKARDLDKGTYIHVLHWMYVFMPEFMSKVYACT